ncbi:hypothetical protein ASD11_14820 [Aeromicrobium sp. Root495]|uniref:hypothetical protein n=1 Tax=Aeromicrobium sp. Root495 TaxID=1736550 RepID=UPI0006FF412E|nr:hypothetical protein [Aeromicrobium sp. Root495]KQY55777.1 hypothetical protein ASD11_14820 [Aeromicrobium sp. Root495]
MSETGNPLLDAFQRLQPDVDVVVLPPEPPLELLETSDPAEAQRAAQASRTTAHSLLEEVRGAGEPVVIERWDRLAPQVHRHRTRVRVTFDDDAAALSSILDVLESLNGAGWETRPVDAPTPWLVARSPLAAVPLLTADVAVQGPRLVVTVESAALRLEEDPA